MFDVLPVGWQIAALRPGLVLNDRETGIAQLLTKLILLLHKVVLSKVVDAQWIPGVRLESSLKERHRLLSDFEIIYIRCNLYDTKDSERHRGLGV